MNSPEIKYFEELKQDVVAAFRKTHPNCKPELAEWKGQDITDFQEELILKVHGRLSEKWFYTHLKSPTTRLPRIDMLNMLSEYAGYKNWNDFLGERNKVQVIEGESIDKNEAVSTVKTEAGILQVNDITSDLKTKPAFSPERPSFISRKIIYVVMALGILFLAKLIYNAVSSSGHTYKCCFMDFDGNTPIANKVRITLIRTGESAVYVETNENGCLELSEPSDQIKYVISTPYFRPDTILRKLNKEVMDEKISLKRDDYALMIHFFSNSNIKDWEKRRSQLNEMIAENAQFFQVYSTTNGMELYNKREFIDKLTMPLKSLKNIEILGVKYSGNKITELRFTQVEHK